MPKKRSSGSLKKPSQEAEKPKPVLRPGKIGKEIDDIFGGRKKKQPEPGIKETKEEIAKRERKRKRKEREALSKNPKTPPRKITVESSQNRPRKTTEDGLPVFTEDELGINKPSSGDTRLCPFDCDCCF